MSVLIKGYMEVPKNCVNCPFRCEYNFELFCTITSAQLFSDDLYGFRRHELCPLVEVSVPHRDLVDRKTLMQEVEKYIIKPDIVTPDTATNNAWNECVKTIMYEIKNAHAIIEEEDE